VFGIICRKDGYLSLCSVKKSGESCRGGVREGKGGLAEEWEVVLAEGPRRLSGGVGTKSRGVGSKKCEVRLAYKFTADTHVFQRKCRLSLV